MKMSQEAVSQIRTQVIEVMNGKPFILIPISEDYKEADLFGHRVSKEQIAGIITHIYKKITDPNFNQ